MPSALEIVLVVLVAALFFGASRLAGPMRDAGRQAGRLRRWAAAPSGTAAAAPAGPAALPRPPAAG
ncbi:twin-arginine translocase TatA/TatE family subunit [Stella sp.]|uniref:Sec-independent protein translocase subunit TatA/TatB n=1 Tax=Stella sp. TaxID=2912054 RepID=UPI0035B2C7E8